MERKIKRLWQAIESYAAMKKIYLTVYELLSHIRDDAKEGLQLKDLVNHIYVIRQISKYADDLRKEADGVSHILENIACAIYVTQANTDPIRAALATGTPDIKLAVTIPKRRTEPEKYAELLKFFGLSTEAIDSGVIKAYWPGICERVSELVSEGKPLPPGIDPDKTYPKYTIKIRSIRDLDELIETFDANRVSALKQAEETEVEACDELLTTRPTKNERKTDE